MRKRISATLVAISTERGVTILSRQSKTKTKQPHIKCFGKLIPITKEEITKLSNTTIYYI